MFRPGSLQTGYALCSQYDDALDLPVVPELPDDAEPDAVAARDAAQAERDKKLEVARDRGDFSTLVKPGKVATFWHFRQVPRRSLAWFFGERDRRQLSHLEAVELLFRIALRKVDHFGPYTPDFDGGEHDLLTLESLDKLYEGLGPLGSKVVVELGSLVMQRCLRGASPKS